MKTETGFHNVRNNETGEVIAFLTFKEAIAYQEKLVFERGIDAEFLS